MESEAQNTKIETLKVEIESYIGIGRNNLIFRFTDLDRKVKLDVITLNDRHEQSFLFETCQGHDKTDALNQMLEYVKNFKQKESSYTIQWSLKGESELNTSYFRAKNVMEALDKLFYGRDANAVTVFNVTLNPIA